MPDFKKVIDPIMGNAKEQLLSGCLAFTSILLGVFTFSLVESIDKKNSLLQSAMAWNLLTVTTGLAIIVSGVIILVLFYYGSRAIPTIWGIIIIILFTIIVLMCSIGIPAVGYWLYHYGIH